MHKSIIDEVKKMQNSSIQIKKIIDPTDGLKIQIAESDFDRLFEIAAQECDFIVPILAMLQKSIAENMIYEEGDGQCGLMLRCCSKAHLLARIKQIHFKNLQIVPVIYKTEREVIRATQPPIIDGLELD